MSDSDADTEDYEPPGERYLEVDEWMEGYNPEDRDVINYNRLYLETKRARLAQQALQIEEARKDTDRDQRLIMMFTCVITLCALVLGLQSAFSCTCNLNF
jgi:hypothetical protein